MTKDKICVIVDFPAQLPVLYDIPREIAEAFGRTPIECLKSEDYVVVERQSHIESANPYLEFLKSLDVRGVIITARSTRYDFMARFFAPEYSAPEHPVKSSADTQFALYWASKTVAKPFTMQQVSPRGGQLTWEGNEDRVLI